MISVLAGRTLHALSSTPPLLLVAAALALSGCQSNKASLSDSNLSTASIAKPAEGVSFKKTEELSRQWQANKGNAEIGFAYADQLAMMGQQPTAVSVIRSVSDDNAGSGVVQAAAGRKLMALGDMEAAAKCFERAAAANPNDHQALSALGSAYDQLGRHGEAREQYQKALAIKPDAVATRNNMAMSFALQGQLPEAEKLLRDLMKSSGNNAARVRQNLALVVGLQGRFDEAKKIASEDLPAEQVEANLAYLQQMLSQPNTWKQLQDSNG